MLSLFLSVVFASPTIVVQGAKRVPKETIKSYIKSDLDSNEIVKKLYETGYFENINIIKNEHEIVVTVQEREIIGRVVFEGNKAIKEDTLKEEVKIKSGMPFSKSQIQETTGNLTNLYHRMGKYDIEITPKIIRRQSGSVDLVFEIKEGETKNIQKIIFQGNKSFTTSELEEVLASKRDKWYRFFANDDVFDDERFLQDQYLLKKFYMNHGYLDIQVQQASAEYNAHENGFILLFHIREGKPYDVADIKITSHIPEIKTDRLLSSVTFSKDDTVDAREIETSAQNIEEILIQNGYQFISVEPKFDKKDNKAVVTFHIQESKKSYIKRIRIKGNHHTHDTVIRREILLHEGDPYNPSKVRRTEDNLKDLGFFKNVKIESNPEDELTDLLVDVEEQATGEIMLGGGYSTLDGPLGNIRLIERNFRGTGRILSADFSVAKKRQDFDIGITDPRLFGKKLVGSANIFHTRSTRFDAFTYKTQGFNAGVSYHLSDHWIQGWTYGFSSEHIKQSCRDYSPITKQEQGRYNVSSLTHRIAYDKRNSSLRPSKGYIISLNTTYSGLGGSIKYLRNELSASLYCPITETTLLVFNPRAGRMHKMRRRLRTVDRFNMGMGTFRGFDYGGVGPRYVQYKNGIQTDDPLGGMRYTILSTDLEFPIGLPNEFGMKGMIFSDIGKVWDAGFKDPNIIDRNSMRASVGLGIKWNSPFGPLKFEYAWAVKKAKGDDQRRFLFGYTTPM